MRSLFLVFSILTSLIAQAQVPTISSLSTKVGKPGDLLTISGSNFHTHIDSNIVRFGPVKGAVLTASTNELLVEIPFGGHFGKITVTCNGRTAWSKNDFLPTYDGPNTIAAPSFGGAIQLDAASGWVRDPRAEDIDGDGKKEIIACGTGGDAGDAIRVWQNVDSDNSLDIYTWPTGIDFPLASTPRSMGVGDIDGDGKKDVVVVNNNGTSLAIFHNTSTQGIIDASSFAPAVYYGCSGSPQDLELADIDGDGKLDIILGNHYFNGLITVFHNTSTAGTIDAGSLAPQVHFNGGDYLYNITVADINGDGKTDVAASAWASDSIFIFVNSATSGTIDNNSFEPVIGYPCPSNPQSIYAGDFNSDGKVDLVTCHNDNNFIRVFENTRTSTVLDANSFDNTFTMGTAGQPYELFTIDMTGDNKPEILVTNRTGGYLGVYQNIHSDGSLSVNSFSSDIRFSIGSNCQGMFATDINGDNKPEVLVTSADYNHVGILQNNLSGNIITLGSFGGKISWDTQANSPWDIGLGDFDDDGKPDVLTSNNTGFNATVWPNNTTPGNITFAAQEAEKFHIDFPAIISENQVIDIDSDGKLDLIQNNYNVATYEISRNIHVDGNQLNANSFDENLSFWVADDGNGPDIADLNQDGRADLFNANYSVNLIRVSENTSTPGTVSFGSMFNLSTNIFYASSKVLTADDLDNDGDNDLIMAYPSADRIYFMTNKGNLTLNSSSFFSPQEMMTVDAPTKVYTMDINNDEWRDLIVTSATQGIYIYLNNGTGGPIDETMFDQNYIHLPYTDGTTIYKAFDISDINADGKPDFALASPATNEIIIWLNNSNGINISANDFEEIRIGVGSISASLQVSDFDLDGKPDFYFSDVNDGFSILRNKNGEFDLPVIATYQSTNLCAGGSIDLYAPQSDSYLWSTGETEPSISVNTPGEYGLIVTNGGINDTLAPITISSAPAIDIMIDAPANNEICFGDDLNTSITGNIASYEWNTGASSSFIQPTISDWYYVTGTDPNGCHTMDSVHLTVIDSIVPALSDISLCASEIILDAQNDGADYMWSTTETTQSISVTQPGMYYVQITNLCGTLLDSANVELMPPLSPNFTLPSPQCKDAVINLADTGPGNYSVEWWINNIPISSSASFDHVFGDGDVFSILLIAIDGECRDSITQLYTTSNDPSCLPYCIPTGNTTAGDFIDGVQLQEINNIGTGGSSSPDYTYYPDPAANLSLGSPYSVTVTSGNYNNNEIAAWIDYNQDGDFNDFGEKLGELHSSSSYTAYDIDFSVPSNATVGPTLMRVRINWNNTNMSPCAPYSYGETEDYWINIDQPAGIVETEGVKSTFIYPNPTNGKIYIQSTSKVDSIKCFDVLGNVVCTTNLLTLDLSTLNSGQYYIQIENEDGISIHKLILNND